MVIFNKEFLMIFCYVVFLRGIKKTVAILFSEYNVLKKMIRVSAKQTERLRS